ncbi:hypothetical protein ACROYT_G015372 [Oculina patagonica]
MTAAPPSLLRTSQCPLPPLVQSTPLDYNLSLEFPPPAAVPRSLRMNVLPAPRRPLQEFEELLENTQAAGNWRPGQKPIKELLTLICSRMKNQKTKGIIRKERNPVVPSLLLERSNSSMSRKTEFASPFLDVLEEILGMRILMIKRMRRMRRMRMRKS